MKRKKKQEAAICGGCASDIPKDETIGAGGCAACGDGIPRCDVCHEEHAAECDPGEEEAGGLVT